MVCRETRAGSVAIALARADSGLDDPQVQSLLHQLRHRFTSGVYRSDPSTPADSDRAREYLTDLVAREPRLSERRRATLHRKLASTTGEQLPADLLSALGHLRPASASARRGLATRMRNHAAATGTSTAQATQRFAELRREAPAGRQTRATPTQKAALEGLPTDPATRYALDRMDRESAEGHSHPVVDVTALPEPDPGRRGITAVGWNPDAAQAEIHTSDGIYWLRNVPPGLGQELRDGPDRDAAADTLITNSRYRMVPGTEQSASRAVRCDRCKQWRGDQHTCPALGDVPELDEDGPVDVRTSPAGWLQLAELPRDDAGALAGPVTTPVYGEFDDGDSPLRPAWAGYVDRGTVTGAATAVPVGPATGPAEVDLARMRCTCGRGSAVAACAHMEQARTVIAAAASPTPALLVHREPRHQLAEFLAPLEPDLSTVRYTEDPAVFARDLLAARAAAVENPDAPVPYHRRDALYAGSAHRRFGVEVEYRAGSDELQQAGWEFRADTDHETGYDGEGYDEDQDQDEDDDIDEHGLIADAVIEDLHDAGILPSGYRQPYGTAEVTGWNTWTHEDDASATGELVSPILADTDQAWQQLDTVCSAVIRHAGTEHSGVGSHVHVDAPGMGGNRQAMVRLVVAMARWETELHQIATLPGSRRQRHWGSEFHRIDPTPPRWSELHETFGTREMAVGFTYVNARPDVPGRTSRLEFRLWDGSAQGCRIQAQIAVSAALTDYALRSEAPLPAVLPTAGPPVNAEDLDRPDPSDPGWQQRTAGIRSLLDVLFRCDRDKQQVLAAWATGTSDHP